ncbi:MAG: hypothetical protein SGILL_005222 [Bacillariaceae sp.]
MMSSSDILTEDEFQTRLEAAPFQWPLKPFGVATKDASLAKTASMNKGAETRIYMDLLEARKLYNPRDPTGPLPTSLRPQLNRLLQEEGIDKATTHRVFRALLLLSNDDDKTTGMTTTTKTTTIKVGDLKERFNNEHPMDYYEFIELIGGKETIYWPY